MKAGALWRCWGAALMLMLVLVMAPGARADELPEYRLKAAFLYNFALFTDWPAEVGGTLTLCVLGTDPFGKELEALQGKAVGARSLALQRRGSQEPVKGCQMLFVAPSAIAGLPKLLDELRTSPVLTVADSPDAARQGVMLNMAVAANKVTFEANLAAARAARLGLSAKLLRLATEVLQ